MIATTRPTTRKSSRMAPRRRLALIAVTGAFLAVFAAGDSCTAALRGLAEGGLVSDFEIVDTGGTKFQMSKAAGSTVVFLFWTPSTKMSQKAIQAFQKFAKEYKGQDVEFLAIRETVEKDKPEGDAFSAPGQPARVLPDVGRVVFGKFGVIVMPSTCVVSPDGRLAKYIPLYDDRYPILLAAAIQLAEGKIDEEQWQKIEHPVNIHVDPATARARRISNLADKYFKRRNWDLAAQTYTKALKLKEDYGAAWWGLGKSLLQQNKPKEAAAAFEKIGDQPALRREALLGLGIAQRRLGKIEEAKKLLEQVTHLPPPDGRAHYELGLIAEMQKNEKLALTHYRKALSVIYRND